MLKLKENEMLNKHTLASVFITAAATGKKLCVIDATVPAPCVKSK